MDHFPGEVSRRLKIKTAERWIREIRFERGRAETFNKKLYCATNISSRNVNGQVQSLLERQLPGYFLKNLWD